MAIYNDNRILVYQTNYFSILGNIYLKEMYIMQIVVIQYLYIIVSTDNSNYLFTYDCNELDENSRDYNNFFIINQNNPAVLKYDSTIS